MPSCEGLRGSEMSKMFDMASTGISKNERLANKPKQKYGLFAKFSLSVIISCDVAKNPHVFLTRSKQHIQEIHRHFDGTLNHYCPMVSAANQEQNEFYTFRYMLLQLDKSDFILFIIK